MSDIIPTIDYFRLFSYFEACSYTVTNEIDQTDSGRLTFNIRSTDTFAYCYMIFFQKDKQLRKLPIFSCNLVHARETIVFFEIVTFLLSFFEKRKWRVKVHNRIKIMALISQSNVICFYYGDQPQATNLNQKIRYR